MNSLILQGRIDKVTVQGEVTYGRLTFWQGYEDKKQEHTITCVGELKPVRDVMGGLSESVPVVVTGRVRIEKGGPTLVIIDRVESV